MKCLSAVSAKLIQLIKVLYTLYLKTMHCSNTVCGLLIKDLFVFFSLSRLFVMSQLFYAQL